MVSDWAESANQRRDFRHGGPEPKLSRSTRRAQKNTRRWCKGVEGREHDVEIVFSAKQDYFDRGCHEVPQSLLYDDGWSCYHERQCLICGKVIDWQIAKQDCPTWVGLHNETTVLPANSIVVFNGVAYAGKDDSEEWRQHLVDQAADVIINTDSESRNDG